MTLRVSDNLLIWELQQGPIFVEYMPEDERPEDAGQVYLLIVKASDDTGVFSQEIWFNTFTEAYEFSRKIESSLGPKTYGKLKSD